MVKNTDSNSSDSTLDSIVRKRAESEDVKGIILVMQGITHSGKSELLDNLHSKGLLHQPEVTSLTKEIPEKEFDIVKVRTSKLNDLGKELTNLHNDLFTMSLTANKYHQEIEALIQRLETAKKQHDQFHNVYSHYLTSENYVIISQSKFNTIFAKKSYLDSIIKTIESNSDERKIFPFHIDGSSNRGIIYFRDRNAPSINVFIDANEKVVRSRLKKNEEKLYRLKYFKKYFQKFNRKLTLSRYHIILKNNNATDKKYNNYILEDYVNFVNSHDIKIENLNKEYLLDCLGRIINTDEVKTNQTYSLQSQINPMLARKLQRSSIELEKVALSYDFDYDSNAINLKIKDGNDIDKKVWQKAIGKLMPLHSQNRRKNLIGSVSLNTRNNIKSDSNSRKLYYLNITLN